MSNYADNFTHKISSSLITVLELLAHLASMLGTAGGVMLHHKDAQQCGDASLDAKGCRIRLDFLN